MVNEIAEFRNYDVFNEFGELSFLITAWVKWSIWFTSSGTDSKIPNIVGSVIWGSWINMDNVLTTVEDPIMKYKYQI